MKIAALLLTVSFLEAQSFHEAGDAYTASILKWRQQKETELRADSGWLTVAGLFWLQEGRNSFGSDPAGRIVLPGTPAHLGDLVLQDGRITLEPGGDTKLRLNDGPAHPTELKIETKPDVLKYDDLTFFVIKRGEKFAARLKDKNNPARRNFAGMKFFSVDQQYRVDAKLLPSNPPRMVPIPTILGTTVEMPSPGVVQFSLNGMNYQLTPVLETPDSKELFFIFGDQTNAKSTYGAGRFLYTELPKEGKVILDFNKAENPPCAFTPYATCPLPPKENKLQVGIPVGEKYTGTHGK